jgi:uncharacterized protein (DUF983 family)
MMAEHDFGQSVWNGLRLRCPRCGQGKLFKSYLKLVQRCEECGLDITRARADDLPPYIAITIVGHVLVAGLLHFEMSGANIAPWVYLVISLPLAVMLPLLTLPSIKGGVVAFQWSRGMHGFNQAD